MKNKLKTLFLIVMVSILSSAVYSQGATILLTQSSDTIGTFRTNVNTSLSNLNNALSSSTEVLGSIASIATTTGNLIIGSGTAWSGFGVCADGKVLTGSSTATLGWSCETVGGITSLNGSTSSTQTFATASSSGTYSISTANGVHTLTIPNNVGWFTNDSSYITLTSLSASLPISYNNGIGAFTWINPGFITSTSTVFQINLNGNYVSSLQSGNSNISVSSATGTSTITASSSPSLSAVHFSGDSSKISTGYGLIAGGTLIAPSSTTDTSIVIGSPYSTSTATEVTCTALGSVVDVTVLNNGVSFATTTCGSAGAKVSSSSLSSVVGNKKDITIRILGTTPYSSTSSVSIGVYGAEQ